MLALVVRVVQKLHLDTNNTPRQSTESNNKENPADSVQKRLQRLY
jgi:hypothetical protein